MVEIASADPQLGVLFYTLPQEKLEKTQFIRDRGQCLICHASSRTLGVPGYLVRSVYPDRSGRPFFGSGTFATDYRSPFKQRWGGWYVTGAHGELRHMGNVTVRDPSDPENLDTEAGANVTDLKDLLNVEPYLSPHSDIVALMVLEHQIRMHNMLTLANHETRSAIYHDQILNQAFGRPPGHRSDSTRRRIKAVGDKLVQTMLFADEFQLEYPIEGTSTFAEEFSARGPRDSLGRSLRELDLKRRLMKYPCSYLIYSKSFDGLPTPVKEYVFRQLWQTLRDNEPNESLAHLNQETRKEILAILLETKSDLPDYWRDSPASRKDSP